MKVRVVYKPDKSVVVIHPVLKSRRPGEDEAAWLDRVFKKTTSGTDLDGLPFDDIDHTELPGSADKEFREGEKGKKISVNATKAKKVADDAKLKKLVDDEKEKILEQQAIDSLKAQGLYQEK
jgi:hypothetical protein